jgi:hypothetical protein
MLKYAQVEIVTSRIRPTQKMSLKLREWKISDSFFNFSPLSDSDCSGKAVFAYTIVLCRLKNPASRLVGELKSSRCRESSKCKETGPPPKGWGVRAKHGQFLPI